MQSAGQNIVEVTNGGSLVKAALDMCRAGKRTLIVAERDRFVPSIHTIHALRSSVSICEGRCYFSAVTKNFSSFDCFVIAGSMSHFEQEFFRQLRGSTEKEIIEIRSDG